LSNQIRDDHKIVGPFVSLPAADRPCLVSLIVSANIPKSGATKNFLNIMKNNKLKILQYLPASHILVAFVAFVAFVARWGLGTGMVGLGPRSKKFTIIALADVKPLRTHG
jgi:hypothetical protein